MRFILNETTDRNILKIEWKKGDDWWRYSIWVTFWWFGTYYWLVIFLSDCLLNKYNQFKEWLINRL
jgi:hypothetical protein